MFGTAQERNFSVVKKSCQELAFPVKSAFHPAAKGVSVTFLCIFLDELLDHTALKTYQKKEAGLCFLFLYCSKQVDMYHK